MASLSIFDTNKVYFSGRAQIVSLQIKEAPTIVISEYFNFADIFTSQMVAKLPKHTRIDDYAINLVKNRQSSYAFIYCQRKIELETLKIYIKTNLPNAIKKSCTSPTNIPIIFVLKFDRCLDLYVDYSGFHYETIKKQYPRLLIDNTLDGLGWVKQFTQLDMTWV